MSGYRGAVCGTVMLMILPLFGAAASGSGQKPEWHEPFLPQSAVGWGAAGPVRVCDRTNLFDYMNGAGELYLAYDFRDLAVREYTKPGASKVTAEVYRMTTSGDAYGVFSCDRGASMHQAKYTKGLGQEHDYAAGLLRFWKGGFFVRILAERETADSRAAVLALGRLISERMREEGKRPELTGKLPEKGLTPGSIHYFHTHHVLNYHYYLSDANILNLGERTEAVIARYESGKARPRVLIVRYAAPEDAAAAYGRFQQVYFKDRPAVNGSVRVELVEKGLYVGVRQAGPLLRLAFDAPSEDVCRALLVGD